MVTRAPRVRSRMKRIPPWLGPVITLIGVAIVFASFVVSLDHDAATAWVLVGS